MAEIKTLAIVGAGRLGRDIAYAAALAGYRTILEDILPAILRKAESEVRGHLDRAIFNGRISQVDAGSAFGRIEYAGDVEEAARQADLVIEAVPDELESKLEIFTLLDKVSKPPTILASTTATISISELASITYRADRILGIRFSYPIAEMESLEIVRTTETDDDTVAVCTAIGRRMGKKVLVIADSASSSGRCSDLNG
jgi:3-hydroxybutyryl-CoA dehydrogenase